MMHGVGGGEEIKYNPTMDNSGHPYSERQIQTGKRTERGY